MSVLLVTYCSLCFVESGQISEQVQVITIFGQAVLMTLLHYFTDFIYIYPRCL